VTSNAAEMSSTEATQEESKMIIKNANLYMSDGNVMENAYLSVSDGKISAIGSMSDAPEFDAEVYDAAGGFLLPGLIDPHTHLGMWEDSLGFEGADGNEETDPITPHLRAIDGINPVDLCFAEAVDYGITSVVAGMGSANPIGGQLLAMKTFGKCVDDMVIKSPIAVKFALGENPKTVYNGKNQAPMTRMATAAVIREALFKAKKYLEKLEKAENDEDAEEPEFDIKNEALIPLLKREIAAHFHAHRADDIFTAVRLSEEFGLDLRIVHGTDGASIANELAAKKVDVFVGPVICDRSKPELKSKSDDTAAVLANAGVSVSITTDHSVVPIQHLMTSAQVAMKAGLSKQDAFKAITVNPAKSLGLDKRIGSLAVGLDADMALFENDPLDSLFEKPKMVFVNGKRVR